MEHFKKTLRVATYNVHFGANTSSIVDVFRNNQNLSLADVIFFQEIEEYDSEKGSRAGKIAENLGFHFFYAPARPTKKPGTHGIATLSRYPLLDSKVIELARHNLYFSTRQRIALCSDIEIGGKRVALCNVHLDARLNIEQRIDQLDSAVKIIRQSHQGRSILGGDFNTIPFLLAGRMVPVFYRNQPELVHRYLLKQGFVYRCEPVGFTMKRGFLKMYLDHIYTNGLPIISCGVEYSVTASDHKPVWADVAID